MFFIITSAKLDKQVRKNIRNGNYSQEELERIHLELKDEIEEKKPGLNQAKTILIILAVIFIAFALTASFEDRFNLSDIVLSLLIVILVIGGIYLYIRYAMIGKLKRQFNKAVNKGYPELSDTLTLD